MTVRSLVLMGWLVVGLVAAVADAQTLRVTADRTSLRDKPAPNGAIVANIVRGDELMVIERAGTWYKVRSASGAEGYVSSLLVDTVAGGATSAARPAAAPATAATPAPAPAPAPAAASSRATATPPTAAPQRTAAPAATAAPSAAPAATATAAAVQTTAPDSGGSGRSTFLRVLGGVTSGYGDLGFLVGAGVGLRPFGNKQIEIAVDGLLGRSGENYNDAAGSYDVSTTLLSGAGTVLYNFNVADLGFLPFAGVGMTIARATVSADSDLFDTGSFSYSGTGSALHLSAGLEKPFGARAFRAEYRSTFNNYGYGAILLFGLTF